MMIGNAKIQLNHLSFSLSHSHTISLFSSLSVCIYLPILSLSVSVSLSFCFCFELSIKICNHTYHTHIYLRSSEPTHYLPLAHSHTFFDAQCVWFSKVRVCVCVSVWVCVRDTFLLVFRHLYPKCHLIPRSSFQFFRLGSFESLPLTTTYILNSSSFYHRCPFFFLNNLTNYN